MPRQLPPPVTHNKMQMMSGRHRRWTVEEAPLYTLAAESAALCLGMSRQRKGDIEVRKMTPPQSGTHPRSNWTGLRPQKGEEKTKEKCMLKRTKMASSAW